MVGESMEHDVEKIADNAASCHIFNPTFYYELMLYKTYEIDINGALAANKYYTAHIANKEAIKYLLGALCCYYNLPIDPANHDFWMMQYKLRDVPVLSEVLPVIVKIYKSTVVSESKVQSEISLIREYVYSIFGEEVRSVLGHENEVDFNSFHDRVHMVSHVISKTVELDSKQLSRETTEYLKDISKQVCKGR